MTAIIIIFIIITAGRKGIAGEALGSSKLRSSLWTTEVSGNGK
jgi:hypothetical protein